MLSEFYPPTSRPRPTRLQLVEEIELLKAKLALRDTILTKVHDIANAEGDPFYDEGAGLIKDQVLDSIEPLFRDPKTSPKLVPDDVRDLVVAARHVAYGTINVAALKKLDEAAEAFATRVEWEDDPTVRRKLA